MYPGLRNVILPGSVVYLFTLLSLALSSLLSCRTAKPYPSVQTISLSSMVLQNRMLSNSFTGFVLYDPINSEEIININGNKLFTPASITKIFTFWVATNILKDSIPALKYYISGDSLVFMGTGNPCVMNNNLPEDNTLIDFLKDRKEKLFYSDKNFEDMHFGDGWAWDDFMHFYQPEKSPLPVYGNLLYIWHEDDSLYVDPEIFRKKIEFISDSLIKSRKIATNEFSIGISDKFELTKIPFRTDEETIIEILEYITGKEIERFDDDPGILKNGKVLMQSDNDSIYIRMLHSSDNFIAEQLLMMSSFMLFDTISTKKLIDFAISELLPYLNGNCRWVDGSGLSRYNLFSPNSVIHVLLKIWNRFGIEGVRFFFPEINFAESGKYARNPGSVYAKTGTLSNNFNISGFIVTNRSNVYLFSFMVNHFTESNSAIRTEVKEILRFVIDNY